MAQVFSLGCFVEPKNRSIVRPNQCARKQKELVAKRSQGEALPIIRQACTLKGGDQVIGKADDLKIEIVGRESTRGDISQGEIFTQFADAHFDGSSTVVEMPDARWGEVQVGDPASVVVASQLEQRQVVFRRLHQSARQHMASGF